MSGVWAGGEVSRVAVCVLAPNPGPMTLDGTNTWVLRDPGTAHAVVVDPGPLDLGHLQSVLDAVLAREATVSDVVVTHGHHDHTDGAARLAELAGGVPVHAVDPAHRHGGGHGLDDGSRVGALGLEVVATPGHTADSVCLLLRAPGEHLLLTGDTVLGRGTTVVAHPDGALGPYLASLHRLRQLGLDGPLRVLPGHGPVLPEALPVLDAYLAHREQRLEQVRAALAAGDTTPEQVVARVYADVPPDVQGAALQSVRAQLDHLAGT
ncbi:MBL fold metallo-hydrolase [Angustibacter aerolatus]